MAYEMRPCEACGGDRPHNARGKCVGCRQRAKRRQKPGGRAYEQARALLKAKRTHDTKTRPKVSPTKQAAKAALPIAQGIVRRRAKLTCETCGRHTPKPDAEIHHRQPRKAGGTARVEVNSAGNLLYLCLPCHRRIELNRTEAYQLGRLVFASGVPSRTPVLLKVGWSLLGDDGSITVAPPPDEEVS